MARTKNATDTAMKIRSCITVSFFLELDQDRADHAGFIFDKVRGESFHDRSRGTLIAAGRRHSTSSGEVGDVGGAIIVFRAKGDVLAWHVIPRQGGIPRLEFVAWILCEIRSS